MRLIQRMLVVVLLASSQSGLALAGCKPITIDTYKEAVDLLKRSDKIKETTAHCTDNLDSLTDAELNARVNYCENIKDKVLADFELYTVQRKLFLVDIGCAQDGTSETAKFTTVRYKADGGFMTIVYSNGDPVSVTQVGLK